MSLTTTVFLLESDSEVKRIQGLQHDSKDFMVHSGPQEQDMFAKYRAQGYVVSVECDASFESDASAILRHAPITCNITVTYEHDQEEYYSIEHTSRVRATYLNHFYAPYETVYMYSFYMEAAVVGWFNEVSFGNHAILDIRLQTQEHRKARGIDDVMQLVNEQRKRLDEMITETTGTTERFRAVQGEFCSTWEHQLYGLYGFSIFLDGTTQEGRELLKYLIDTQLSNPNNLHYITIEELVVQRELHGNNYSKMQVVLQDNRLSAMLLAPQTRQLALRFARASMEQSLSEYKKRNDLQGGRLSVYVKKLRCYI